MLDTMHVTRWNNLVLPTGRLALDSCQRVDLTEANIQVDSLAIMKPTFGARERPLLPMGYYGTVRTP